MFVIKGINKLWTADEKGFFCYFFKRHIRKVRYETRDCWWDRRPEIRDPSQRWDPRPETRDPNYRWDPGPWTWNLKGGPETLDQRPWKWIFRKFSQFTLKLGVYEWIHVVYAFMSILYTSDYPIIKHIHF